ncbi:MAG: pilus assembly protein [Hyphomicrobiales bacterium]
MRRKYALIEGSTEKRVVGPRAVAAVIALLAFNSLALWIRSAGAGVDLSDLPMFTRIVPPPANIMFLLDDSASMNYEILLQGAEDGRYPDQDGFCYVFDDLGDNVFKQASAPNRFAGAEGRKLWWTQWHQKNVMYYNPNVTYTPWPSYGNKIFLDADPDKPRSHPLSSSIKLDLQETSFTVANLNVPHAHYFVYSAKEGKPYLVVIDKASSAMKYYAAAVTGTGTSEKVSTLTQATTPPVDVVTGRTYSAERQNFANWFTYYRRREYVAKNALASVLKSLNDVRVGIYGINQKIISKLEPVNVTTGASVTDNTQALLDLLYPYESDGVTPLKEGLHTVGKFFKTNDGTIGGKSGPAPYGATGQGAACQQSFTVILTDGYYSDTEYQFGGGNADGDNGAPYADSLANTLADIAMYYYETDLNALPDQVPASQYDQATHQHMATYAVAFGVTGSLNPADYDESFHHKATGNLVQWPTSINSRKPETIDDLWHATVNGHGKFYNAANPQQLATKLTELMNAISKILIGSSSAVTVNGDYLYGKIGPDTYLYQALYSNQNDEWTGDIKRFPVDPYTGDVQTTGHGVWSAAEKLVAAQWDKRHIATFSGSAGIPFREASLTDSQKSALGANPSNKVKYLRGGEVSGFRQRSQKLGDIVNSAPVFLDDVVYAGSNDGMLHAFDADTGEEIFGYVPNLVFDNLKLLTDPAYTHRFYVDLTPTVKKAAGILGGTATRALLIGGLRKGGKGYFALDVTDAKTINTEADLASRVLWEFPNAADPDMGYSFSKPVIVRSNHPTYPWAVIFGNGYKSDSGKSMLYIVDAATGVLILKIEAGTGPDNGLSSPVAVDVTYDGKVDFVYAGDLKGQLWKFDLGSESISEWRVAFSDGAGSKPLFQAKGPGGVEQMISTRPDVMYHPVEHGFLVCFGTGRFLGDNDFTDTSIQSIYGIWDYGDRVYSLKSRQWGPDDDREFLGAIVRSSPERLSNQPDTVSLLKQTQKVYTVKIGAVDYRFRVLSSSKPIWLTRSDPEAGQQPNPSNTDANHAGYYFDMNPGERVISDVMIRDGNLLAIGFTPNIDPCGPGGTSMFMELNAFTGGAAGGSLFDITGDLKINAKDVIQVDFIGDGKSKDMPPSGIEFMGNLLMPAILRLPGDNDPIERKYMSSSSGKIETLTEKGVKLGVTYWMEIRF